MLSRIKIGTLVSYSNDPTYIGVVVSFGSTMLKIRWLKTDVEEWMPEYALRIAE